MQREKNAQVDILKHVNGLGHRLVVEEKKNAISRMTQSSVIGRTMRRLKATNVFHVIMNGKKVAV